LTSHDPNKSSRTSQTEGVTPAVDTGAALPLLFVGAGVLFGALILGYLYYSWQRQLNDENTRIKTLQAQKTDLEQVKTAGRGLRKAEDGFTTTGFHDRTAPTRSHRRPRTSRRNRQHRRAHRNLWLTSMIRKGNNLTLDGASASVNGVANFITALKRSGYFSKIEIKESKQDEKTPPSKRSSSKSTPKLLRRPQEWLHRTRKPSRPAPRRSQPQRPGLRRR